MLGGFRLIPEKGRDPDRGLFASVNQSIEGQDARKQEAGEFGDESAHLEHRQDEER